MSNYNSSTEVLAELVSTRGVNAVVVIGRDGFVIESAGMAGNVEVDALGASLANTISGIEDTGSDLEVGKFDDMHVQYQSSMIMCVPAGEAIVAIVSPDASTLGMIRHNARKLIPTLAEYF